MLLTVQGVDAYCDTGGRHFDRALPTAVFIHGAQNDHSVWAQQAHYFAHHGYGVLAVDLPGHGRSGGAAKASVEEMADWLLALLDAAGVESAALFGHSMGSLVALEAAFRAPGRVSRLAMLGTAWPMKVSDALLAMSRDDEASAIDMVVSWSHSATMQASHCGPGLSVTDAARQLMRRISAINPAQVFYTDFSACNAYANGETAAHALRCPALFIVGARDRMTPPKASKLLTAAIAHSQVVTVDCGHAMMAEQPDAVLDALFAFAET
jgi:pimeloyl-ACP methyl ester carboxylesterase